MKLRKEFDSIGSINVPNDKYWGASTQRSKKYFDIGEFLVRPVLIKSIAIIKKSAAIVHKKDKQIERKIANAIIKATNADGFSLAQNNGKAAKQIIPHVHVHIIPRYNSTGTQWTKRKILNDNELDELAKKIRIHLE